MSYKSQKFRQVLTGAHLKAPLYKLDCYNCAAVLGLGFRGDGRPWCLIRNNRQGLTQSHGSNCMVGFEKSKIL